MALPLGLPILAILAGAGYLALSKYNVVKYYPPAYRWEAMTPSEKGAALEMARIGTPEQIYNLSDKHLRAMVIGFAANFKRQDVIDYVNQQDAIRSFSPAQVLALNPEDTRIKMVEAMLKAGRTDVADEINKRGAAQAWMPFLSVAAQAVLFANNVDALKHAVAKQEAEAGMSQRQILEANVVDARKLTQLGRFVRMPY